jgi:cell wall-associated NlpC family hydrolase
MGDGVGLLPRHPRQPQYPGCPDGLSPALRTNGAWKAVLFSTAVGLVAVAVLIPATAAQATPTIQQQITAQERQLEKVIEQYNLLGEQLKRSHAQAAALQRGLAPLQARMDATGARVDMIAAEAYKGAALNEFAAVVSAPDTATVVDRLVTIAELSRYEQQQLQTLREDQDAEQAQMAALNTTIADQTNKRKQMIDQRRKIESGLSRLYALRAQAPAAPSPYSGAGSKPPAVSGRAGVAVDFAYAQLGKPYQYAAAGPNAYDCSGLTMAAWGAAGVSLSHNAAEQWGQVAHISRANLQPGDLVFYDGLGHVAIYVGRNQVIHAPTQGDVVRTASVDMSPPYGYGRPH